MTAQQQNIPTITSKHLTEFLESQKFNRYMVNTLAMALWQWMDTVHEPVLEREYKRRFNALKPALKIFLSSFKVKDPLLENEVEEAFYDASEQFLQILQLMANQKLADEKESLLAVCEILSSGEAARVEELWLQLGRQISSQKIVKQ